MHIAMWRGIDRAQPLARIGIEDNAHEAMSKTLKNALLTYEETARRLRRISSAGTIVLLVLFGPLALSVAHVAKVTQGRGHLAPPCLTRPAIASLCDGIACKCIAPYHCISHAAPVAHAGDEAWRDGNGNGDGDGDGGWSIRWSGMVGAIMDGVGMVSMLVGSGSGIAPTSVLQTCWATATAVPLLHVDDDRGMLVATARIKFWVRAHERAADMLNDSFDRATCACR